MLIMYTVGMPSMTNTCRLKINIREGHIEIEGPQTWVERQGKPCIKALQKSNSGEKRE